jgi:hypothetical protein
MGMQVTDAMVAAAQDATRRWMNATDSEIRYIVEAALEAAGSIDLPVTATVRVQIDEQAFHASAAEAVQRLHDGLPRDAEGRITLASLRGDADRHEVPDGTTDGPQQSAIISDALLDTSGFEDVAAVAAQRWMPVTSPRPLATADQLHHHLGIGAVEVANMLLHRNDYRPPFPAPVHEADARHAARYDPQGVKTWYDALPQAVDE